MVFVSSWARLNCCSERASSRHRRLASSHRRQRGCLASSNQWSLDWIKACLLSARCCFSYRSASLATSWLSHWKLDFLYHFGSQVCDCLLHFRWLRSIKPPYGSSSGLASWWHCSSGLRWYAAESFPLWWVAGWELTCCHPCWWWAEYS